MAIVKAFRAIRPNEKCAAEVAALPYDVYNRSEAKAAVAGKPLSFLNIDRAETQFDDSVDTYADCVYDKARELFEKQLHEGIYIQEQDRCFYIYELTMNGRTQTGLVACSSIDEYLDGTIAQHEKTRADKELDRIRHVDTMNAQTGPIFLAYRNVQEISDIIANVKATQTPINDFVGEDGVGHRVFRIADSKVIERLETLFEEQVPNTYIADGHHRAASAVKVGLKRREENPDYTGAEEFNTFLSVLFPDEQLMIMPYNRVVKDLNGNTEEAFMDKLREIFEIMPSKDNRDVAPEEKGTLGMYLDGKWYVLKIRDTYKNTDPVDGLDVSLLQNLILEPVLGIDDPKTNKRIDFVGGIRGTKELVRRVDSKEMKVAFSMYPTSIQELLNVADASRLMPPKSTWFEPKLRSGLFIHSLS